MKKLVFISAVLSVMFSACSKDNDVVNNSTTPVVFDDHSSQLMIRMHAMSDSMDMMMMTGDPDYDFAMMMKMHHMGAIDMASYELTNGNDSTIRIVAQAMMDSQMMEIGRLDSFIMAHTITPMMTDFEMKSEEAMHLMDINADAQTLNGDSDHDFAHLMMPHHQSATTMAMAVIESGQVQMIKDMAQEMIQDQQMEITTLQIWLNSNN